jgi:chaperonin GroEL (HSP60 family)
MGAISATTSTGVPVIILKEGATETKGKVAQRNNFTAIRLVSEIMRTLLGPRGMDKMLVDSLGDVTITNDGATVLKEMDIQHPAAKMLVEVAKSVDNEVGDGTTSSVILAGALIDKAEDLINKDVHPTIIVDGYRRASRKALETLNEIAEKVSANDKSTLAKIADTSMQTKIVSEHGKYLAELVVDAVLRVAEKMGENYRADIDDVRWRRKLEDP